MRKPIGTNSLYKSWPKYLLSFWEPTVLRHIFVKEVFEEFSKQIKQPINRHQHHHKMGLLTFGGENLPFSEIKKHADYVKKHAIIQFINTYNRVKNRTYDTLKWGDEVSHFWSLPLPVSTALIVALRSSNSCVFEGGNIKICDYNWKGVKLCLVLIFSVINTWVNRFLNSINT